VELDPEYLIAWYNLANAYRVAQQFNQAVVCYQHAIDLKPDFPLAHDGLCQSTFQLEHRSLQGKRSFSKSLAAYEQWLACEPENALPQFMLQAIRGDEKLTRAPDSVVRNMFDQFAASFEQHLESLEYKLPQQMTGMLQELLGPAQSSLKVLDGGCGTGLCAPALKPWASNLIGVDISSAMLDKAREKQLYDGLIESELTHFLKQHQAAFDLIVFADTLIYFGDLDEVLKASAHALGNGGALLFTLEASPAQNSSRDYSLHPTGRYSHSAVYVEKVLKASGFSQIRIDHDSTRNEVGKAVPGLVVSALKLQSA
jgi:predicted TPR repeat methyltransferase